MASGPITSWQIDGETMETVTDFFLGASKSLQMVTAAMKLKAPWMKSYAQPRQQIEKPGTLLCQQSSGKAMVSYGVSSSLSYGFSSSHVWM